MEELDLGGLLLNHRWRKGPGAAKLLSGDIGETGMWAGPAWCGEKDMVTQSCVNCTIHIQTNSYEGHELCACPRLVTSNTVFSIKPWECNQACDTCPMVASPAELKLPRIYMQKEKHHPSSPLLQPAHKSVPEFLLKLKPYLCIQRVGKETEENIQCCT